MALFLYSTRQELYKNQVIISPQSQRWQNAGPMTKISL